MMGLPKRGTPKTLDEAIRNALYGAHPLVGGTLADTVHAHVKDFLAQRFGALYLSQPEAVVRILEALFQECTQHTKNN